jgi:pyruvate formate lyase activating enzyme
MTKGIVFDIKEFAVHDGPGIRTTVFLKGCPLSCSWCHNPEGISPKPQIIRSPAGERLVGTEYSSDELAAILKKQADILRLNDGGVTFSGGEPLAQAKFIVEVIDQLDGIHVLLDTSGYASEEDFCLVASRCDLVYFDLKLIDSDLHRRFTGRDNGPILRNLRVLSTLGVPFVVRVPMVPGVTDTDKNLTQIAETVKDLPGLLRVDLLRYNRAAGGKYESAGVEFKPGFDESKEVNVNRKPFEAVGVEVAYYE